MSLVVSNLSACIDRTTVLDDVSFSFEKTVSVIGPSGSGKTTLLRAIAGLQAHTGTITHGDHLLDGPVHARNIGFVEQTNTLFPHMTITQNVAYPLKVRGVSRARRLEQVQHMLETVEIAHLGERLPQQVSGGEQQRVAIARALMSQPKILLLDEPFRGLDAILRFQMRTWLRDLIQSRSMTTVFVTHDMRAARQFSEHGVVFDHGRVVAQGEWSTIAASTHPTVMRLQSML
jgi:putative spermidine/putrescine transport system ATP-binding protein